MTITRIAGAYGVKREVNGNIDGNGAIYISFNAGGDKDSNPSGNFTSIVLVRATVTINSNDVMVEGLIFPSGLIAENDNVIGTYTDSSNPNTLHLLKFKREMVTDSGGHVTRLNIKIYDTAIANGVITTTQLIPTSVNGVTIIASIRGY